MKYKRFEELPVWKSAIDLAVRIYALTASREFKNQRSLRDQLERAVVSISNNIAEGFERGTNQELLTFIYIARGSSGEVRSMLHLLEALPLFANLKPQLQHLNVQANNIASQLGGWATSLQNSGIKGQRYLTDKSRRILKGNREREEFLEQLRQMNEQRIELEEKRIAELQDREAGYRESE
jgi:four helix bundle protein